MNRHRDAIVVGFWSTISIAFIGVIGWAAIVPGTGVTA